MELSDIVIPVVVLGSCAVSIPTIILINEISGSVKTYIKARAALDYISLGEKPRKYTNDIQDAKIDGLAGWLLGKKALYEACRKGRQAREEITH